MSRNSRKKAADAQLDELYAQVPQVACRGYCHTTCLPIQMSGRERERIRERHGVDIPDPLPSGGDLRHVEPVPCPALTILNRCSVYEDRPLVCRMWGASELLPCIYGCAVEGGPLPLADEQAMNAAVFQIGGYPAGIKPGQMPAPEEVRERLEANPVIAGRLRDSARAGQFHDRRRARENGLGHLLAPETGEEP